MDHPIISLTDWLNDRKQQALLITKREYMVGKNVVEDTDQVELQFENVTLSRASHDPDDYISDHYILLHGRGKVYTDSAAVDLPRDVFEIPLDSSWKIKQIGEAMHIETERATYEVKPVLS
jgi:mannose-6-phosphate isomerase-like protein (cupin superfamily)